MYNTLKISFALRNAYRVNAILFSLKQIPLIKRILPDSLYRNRGLKIFANVVSIIWEVLSIFIGKALFLSVMVFGAMTLYGNVAPDRLFLHLLVILTVLGGFINSKMFGSSKSDYYAVVLLRMNARRYVLLNYIYSMGKVVAGNLPFTILFGRMAGLPLWLCVLLPFAIAGCKLGVNAWSLVDYEKKGVVYNEMKLVRQICVGSAAAVVLAYAPPAVGFVLPAALSTAIFVLMLPVGAAGIVILYRFRLYREMNQEILAETQVMNASRKQTEIIRQSVEKGISEDTSVTSNRQGFEYLNELFIRRHKKILWKSTEKISWVCAGLVCAALLLFYLRPETRETGNRMVMTYLPYIVFILYAINRGTSFTQALFMNCDHSLLTYSFYKRPECILKLFRIRLREIVKINAVPALIIGGGMALLLFASGGTENPLNYGILIVSTLCASIFFSIHYLTLYYLLQPYNAGTELKSGSYRMIMMVTYLICFLFINLRAPILIFGSIIIALTFLYAIIASILVYTQAPKTFRLRQ